LKRRAAREMALKALFAYDLGKNEPGTVLELLYEEENADTGTREFCAYLANGAVMNIVRIDQKIAGYAREWALERMSAVDRNIMRIAVFELLFSPEIPKAVIINEAIELAKAYGSEESARFINGIVGNIIKDMQE